MGKFFHQVVPNPQNRPKCVLSSSNRKIGRNVFFHQVTRKIGRNVFFHQVTRKIGRKVFLHFLKSERDGWFSQVSTEHGTLYHYYDVCDVPANVERDTSEYLVVKAMAEAGLVHLAEPCIIECHGNRDECARCKKASDFKEAHLPSADKCDPNRKSVGHQEVPWRAERRRARHPHGN
jgi:hypothetical protein